MAENTGGISLNDLDNTNEMGKVTHNLRNMMSLDVYLSSLDKESLLAIENEIPKTKQELHPLFSWDIAGIYLQQLINKAKKAEELHELQKLSRKFEWITDLPAILSNDYYALVITDLSAKIEWVNKDFKSMTGYSEKNIIGNTPRFLQGKNTSELSRITIRQKLTLEQPFKESIINYRKNKEEYSCDVSIFPLRGAQNTVTHFIALEKEMILK